MTNKQIVVTPSMVSAFSEAVQGGRGELDAWLECHDENEVRYFIKVLLGQAVTAERERCAILCETVGKGTSLELVCLSFAEKIRARSQV